MDLMLWLAQVPTPQEGVGIAKELADAGVAVICLFVAGVAFAFAYYQLRRNNKLETAFRMRIDKDGSELRQEQKTLLREMLESEKASRATIMEANKNVETFELTLAALCEQIEALREELSQRGETKKDTGGIDT